MCDSERCPRWIDDTPLSMLGNQISSASFVGLRNPKGRSGRKMEEEKKKKNYKEITRREQTEERGTQPERERRFLEIKNGSTKKKKKNYGSVSPFTLCPLVCYRPSWCSIILDPISFQTVSLSSLRLCHSAQIQQHSSNVHYPSLLWPCGPRWRLFVEL